MGWNRVVEKRFDVGAGVKRARDRDAVGKMAPCTIRREQIARCRECSHKFPRDVPGTAVVGQLERCRQAGQAAFQWSSNVVVEGSKHPWTEAARTLSEISVAQPVVASAARAAAGTVTAQIQAIERCVTDTVISLGARACEIPSAAHCSNLPIPSPHGDRWIPSGSPGDARGGGSSPHSQPKDALGAVHGYGPHEAITVSQQSPSRTPVSASA